jgi:hypothetical protein
MTFHVLITMRVVRKLEDKFLCPSEISYSDSCKYYEASLWDVAPLGRTEM